MEGPAGQNDPRFLALLVHRGLLSVNVVREALASGDAARWLIENGHVSEARWREWVETEAGARPRLSRYELGELLGEGGTARVFRARDRKTGETVALKVLRAESCKDPTMRARFVQEAKMLCSFDCEHIVRGRRAAREGDVVYCAMELIEGDCLQDRIGPGRPLDEELALRVVMQIGEALAYLHGRGLVHRDVKPGNIMLENSGRAVLIDLGFAVPARRVGGGEEEATTTAGTAHYISPEQARGRELDVRADIYSLGATLYHLVTGSLPFSGASHEEVLAKQVREALSSRAIRDMGLSAQTHYFIEKMMAKEKEIRFQSPRALVDEVRTHLERIEHERRAVEEAVRRTRRRRRRFL